MQNGMKKYVIRGKVLFSTNLGWVDYVSERDYTVLCEYNLESDTCHLCPECFTCGERLKFKFWKECN